MSTDNNTNTNNPTIPAIITDIERLKAALDVFSLTSPGTYGELLALAEDAEDERERFEDIASAFSDLAVSADAAVALCEAVLAKLQEANDATIPEAPELPELRYAPAAEVFIRVPHGVTVNVERCWALDEG